MNTDPPPEFIRDAYDDQVFGEADSWYQLVGPLYSDTNNSPGDVRLAFYSEKRYISSMNRVHGGMIASFSDYLLFGAASSAWEKQPLATVSLNVNYVSACPADVWVIGHGRVIHSGRNMAFVSGEIHAENKVIAHSTGTFRKLSG